MSATASATYTLEGRELRGPLTPVEDTVLVRVDKPQEATEGGLFIPETNRAEKTCGTVVAAGEGKRHWDTGVHLPMKVSVGDRVQFGKMDGSEVNYMGEKHMLMRDDDVLFTFEGDEPNMDTAKMVGDRVMLKVQKPEEALEKSTSKVLVAASVVKSMKETTGTVVKTGPGRMAPTGDLMPLYVGAGDRVKFKDFAAEYLPTEALEVDGQQCIVIRNVDVLAKW